MRDPDPAPPDPRSTLHAPRSTPHRPTILFVAEAVTLAHVARPLVLAGGLDPGRFKVVFAVDPRYEAMVRGHPFEFRPIRSIPPAQFLAALADGRPVYDFPTLSSYVADDLALLDAVRPDVVVGDFRLSLSASTRLGKVPCLTITNAYWSPFAPARFPLPELPMSRALGVSAASLLFRVARPIAFALHSRPLDRVRKAHGLPGLGFDLRRAYTDADQTLYADAAELVPTHALPPTHHYLGPLVWSPPVEPPSWWGEIPDDRPIVYATLGSSGRAGLLDAVLTALADLPVTVLAATAGKDAGAHPPSNARTAPFLPGADAARRASLVVCNGGSPTAHQALAAGTPVLGLPSNLDQHLNMEGIVARGAGLVVRSEHARPAAIRAAVARMLADGSFRREAGAVAAIFARYDAAGRFRAILDRVIPSGRPA